MKYYISVLLFLLLTQDAFCQNWLWGKRGGSAGGFTEKVDDMTIDPNNNIYILARVDQLSLNIDGHPRTGYGNTDIMIASFTCDGVFRWSKVIGGSDNDIAGQIKTDTLGHVYVTGRVFSPGNLTQNAVHFDTDTVLAYNCKRTMFLIEYDTSGNYKWMKMPQPDTLSVSNAYSYTQTIDLSVDGSGVSYWLCYLPAGAFAGGSYIVPTLGVYMLKYDKLGNFLSGFPFDITGTSISYKMQRDPLTKRFYIAGNLTIGTLSMGGNTITHAIYIGAFKSNGQLIWKREDTYNTSLGGTVARPVIDTAGNIFLSGTSAPGDTFNNYPFNNNGSADPFIIKLDTNGNNIWAQSAATEGNAAALTTNGEVILAGSYPVSIVWPGYTGWVPHHISNQGYDMCITRFNAQTGAVIRIDTLGSDFGVDDWATAAIADKKGNFYMGGRFGGDLYLPNDTLHTLGGPFDFVVAKYGFSNCNCTSTPTANFTYTANSATHIANFTFTGTMPVDSVHWTFGDGGTSNQTNPSHTYANNNSYSVCVTVYTPCGSNTYCHQATTSVATVSSSPDVAVYPNPANNVLHIDNLKEAASYRIVNLIGSTIQQGTVQSGSNEISLKEIPSGIYLLQLTNHAGQREVVRVVKE